MRYLSSTFVMLLSGCGALLFAGGSAQAGTIRHDISQHAYLQYGANASLASVGKLTTQHAAGTRISTATLIAPDVVLTAAHVLQDANSLSFTAGGFGYTAADWLTHPNWTGSLPAGYDLALVRLSAPITNIAPAERYRGSAELGYIATLAGYGKTGTGLTGATRYDGAIRAGTNRIDSTTAGTGDNARLLWIDFDQPTTYSQRTAITGATAMEIMPALGDSGGSLFVSTPQGLQLAGVNSFTYGTGSVINSRYGDQAGYIRVSAFNEWIDATLQSWANLVPANGVDLAGLDPEEQQVAEELSSDEVATVPEPSSAMLATVALSALLCHARRRRRLCDA